MNCTEKVRFESRALARKALRKIQSTPLAVRRRWPVREGYPPGGRKPVAVYRCPVCHGYHITSKPQ